MFHVRVASLRSTPGPLAVAHKIPQEDLARAFVANARWKGGGIHASGCRVVPRVKVLLHQKSPRKRVTCEGKAFKLRACGFLLSMRVTRC